MFVTVGGSKRSISTLANWAPLGSVEVNQYNPAGNRLKLAMTT